MGDKSNGRAKRGKRERDIVAIFRLRLNVDKSWPCSKVLIYRLSVLGNFMPFTVLMLFIPCLRFRSISMSVTFFIQDVINIYICNFILSVKVKDNSKRIILTMKIVKLISTWNFRSDYWKINNSERKLSYQVNEKLNYSKRVSEQVYVATLYYIGPVMFYLLCSVNWGKYFLIPVIKIINT